MRVKDNDDVFYAIKMKDTWWLPWDFIRLDKWSFKESSGWGREIRRFESEKEAERYLKDNLMEHEVSEYVVKEFNKPSWWEIIFPKKDESRTDYINNLNDKETRWM